MKQQMSFALILGALTIAVGPSRADVTGLQPLPDGAQFAVDGGTLRIQFWSDAIARVTYASSAALPPLKSLSVIANPTTVKLKRQQNARLSPSRRHVSR